MNYRFLFTIFLSLVAFVSFSQVEDEETDEEYDIDIEDVEYDEDADTIDIEDIEVEDIEDDELASTSDFPWERFAVGGNLGNLQFGDVTSIGVSPEVNYSLNDQFRVGVGGIYNYLKYKYIYRRNAFGYERVEVDNAEERNTGYRPFLRFQPTPTFPVFVQTEFEGLSQETILGQSSTSSFETIEQNVNNINAGLGLNQGPTFILLTYNFMNKRNKDEFFDIAENEYGVTYTDRQEDQIYPYNALSFRTGFNFQLGQGDKNKRKKKKKKDREEVLPN